MITKKRLLKNSKERQHKEVNLDDVKILSKNFKTNEKRKISEALSIRSFKPTLNVQPWSTLVDTLLDDTGCTTTGELSNLMMDRDGWKARIHEVRAGARQR